MAKAFSKMSARSSDWARDLRNRETSAVKAARSEAAAASGTGWAGDGPANCFFHSPSVQIETPSSRET